MRSLAYKKLIWNTTWYRQNSTQALNTGWTKNETQQAQEPLLATENKDQRTWALKNFFPWWQRH